MGPFKVAQRSFEQRYHQKTVTKINNIIEGLCGKNFAKIGLGKIRACQMTISAQSVFAIHQAIEGSIFLDLHWVHLATINSSSSWQSPFKLKLLLCPVWLEMENFPNFRPSWEEKFWLGEFPICLNNGEFWSQWKKPLFLFYEPSVKAILLCVLCFLKLSIFCDGVGPGIFLDKLYISLWDNLCF